MWRQASVTEVSTREHTSSGSLKEALLAMEFIPKQYIFKKNTKITEPEDKDKTIL